MNKHKGFTMYAKEITKERRSPFDVSADPFCSDSNMKHLETVVSNIEAGRATLVEHDLIEE